MRALLRRTRKAAASRKVPDHVQTNISYEWDEILNEAVAFPESLPPLASALTERPRRRRDHNCARRLRRHKEVKPAA